MSSGQNDHFNYSISQKNRWEKRYESEDVYRETTIPSFQEFFPKMRNKFGRPFSTTVKESLSEFQRDFFMRQLETRQSKYRGAGIQDSRSTGRSFGDRDFIKSNYKLPLCAVRPECVDVPRITPNIPDGPPMPYCNTENFENFYWRGNTGKKPFTSAKFGENHQATSYSALCDFTNNYHFRKSVEWSPAPLHDISIGMENSGAEIYPKNTGLLPFYEGHVPGIKHSFGTTFGSESRDAKRYLRVDSHLRTGICQH